MLCLGLWIVQCSEVGMVLGPGLDGLDGVSWGVFGFLVFTQLLGVVGGHD